MTTSYTNSVSYLNSQNWLSAEELGYLNEVFYGVSPMGMIPIAPTSHFMRHEFFVRGQEAQKRTQKRKLNEVPDAKQGNPFKKQTELTSIYFRRTDIDKRLAEKRPAVYDSMLLADAQDLTMDIDYDIFNATPDADGYGLSGLKQRVPIANTGQDVNNGAALIIDNGATEFKTFLRLFREGVDLIRRSPGMQIVAYMNKGLHRAISNGRDQLGANVAGFGYTDILNHRVLTVDDIPLFKLEQDTIGNDILGFDENSESSTSIFLLGIGGTPDEHSKELPPGVQILSSDQVIVKDTETVLRQIQTAQEMDIGLWTPPKTVARISRLKAVS